MINFKRQGIFPFVIFSSVVFSACQQEKIIGNGWVKENNIYTTTLRYDSPGGEEVNKVSLVIKNDTITDVNFEIITKIKTSIEYQKKFGEELPKFIIGKKLSELKGIDKISGASLTTTAFNEALQKLKEQL